jgi:hypothetical protein
MHDEPKRKAQEVVDIDGTCGFLHTNATALRDSEQLLEKLSKEKEAAILEFHWGSAFLKLKRRLFLAGYVLRGFDKFNNGEDLASGEALKSNERLLALLVTEAVQLGFGQYEYGFSNTITFEIDQFVRKLSLTMREKPVVELQETLLLMARTINDEFKDDRCVTWEIGDIQIISANQLEPVVLQTGTTGSDRVARILLLQYADRFFLLTPYDEVVLCSFDKKLNQTLKVNNVVSAVQMEEDLLEELFARRRNVNVSEDLLALYKSEMASLKPVTSMQDFFSTFAENHLSSSTDVLHRYLTLIVEYDDTEQGKDDAASRVKVVKELYMKACLRQIKQEEKRRREARAAQLEADNQEQNFLQHLLEESGKDREVALAEIEAKRCEIDADESLIGSLLEERATAIREGSERMTQLSELRDDLRTNLAAAHARIKELNDSERATQQERAEEERKVQQAEEALEGVEKEIAGKEAERRSLNADLTNMLERQQQLTRETDRLAKEKEVKEKEREDKEIEIKASVAMDAIIANLKVSLGNYAYKSELEPIKRAISEESTLSLFFSKLLEKHPAFSQDIRRNVSADDEKAMEDCITWKRNIAGENDAALMLRLRSIIVAAVESYVRWEPGSSVFCVWGTNLCYSAVYERVNKSVEYLLKTEYGLQFMNKSLCSLHSSVKSIDALPGKLRQLVKRRMELTCRPEEVKSQKAKTLDAAGMAIDALQIASQDVIRCFIDVIEVTVCNMFILDCSQAYPGIRGNSANRFMCVALPITGSFLFWFDDLQVLT